MHLLIPVMSEGFFTVPIFSFLSVLLTTTFSALDKNTAYSDAAGRSRDFIK